MSKSHCVALSGPNSLSSLCLCLAFWDYSISLGLQYKPCHFKTHLRGSQVQTWPHTHGNPASASQLLTTGHHTKLYLTFALGNVPVCKFASENPFPVNIKGSVLTSMPRWWLIRHQISRAKHIFSSLKTAWRIWLTSLFFSLIFKMMPIQGVNEMVPWITVLGAKTGD